MDSEALSIGELADAAGLTRRAIRFYVQQKLLPPPLGRGRGNHYDARHLSRLRRVIALQQAGHSLEAIRQVLARDPDDGEKPELPHGSNGSSPRSKGRLTAVVRDEGELPGEVSGPPVPVGSATPQAAGLSARLWTRLILAEGIELSFDATKFNPTVEQLLTIRQRVRRTLLDQE
jgi:DNA-binding transcriptional MerR regulator